MISVWGKISKFQPYFFCNQIFVCSRSKENIRKGQSKEKIESWRKTLEEKCDRLADKLAKDNQEMKAKFDKLAKDNQEHSDKFDKLVKDNQEMKAKFDKVSTDNQELSDKLAEHNQEMKVLLEKIFSQTIKDWKYINISSATCI